jgi:hypothetical protein
MKSLRDLNSSSKQGVPFADTRSYALTFDRATPTSQTLITYPNEPFTLEPGIEITSIVNAANSFVTTSNINGYTSTTGLRYTIQLTQGGTIDTASNVFHQAANIAKQVSFAGVPMSDTGYTPLTNVGTGSMWASYALNTYPTYTTISFEVNGIKSKGDWDLVKSPVIDYDIASLQANIFQSNITGNGISKSWYTTVNPVIVNELTTPSDAYYYSDSYSGMGDHNTSLTGTPTVSNIANVSLQTSSYTCTITGNYSSAFGNLSSTGTLGGTTSWDSNNKRLTITGNASQVTSHLSNLKYNAPSNYSGTFLLTYALYNPVTKYTSTKTQYVKNYDNDVFSEPMTDYYDDNAITTLTSGPTIVSATVSGYTVTVTADLPASVYSITSGGSGGTSTWNSGTKTLTLTGTKTQVNSHLASIIFEPVDDFRAPINLIYSLTNGAISSSQIQPLVWLDRTLSVSNLSVARDYVGNTSDQQLFKVSQPQINEDAVGTPTYAVTLTSSAGSFTLDGTTASSPFTFSGSQTYVNEQFYNVLFRPAKDVVGSQTLNIRVLRDSVEIGNQTVAFTGTMRTSSIATGTYTITSSGTTTVALDQVLYLNCDILLVGGGGGGGKVSTGTGGGGGGGGVLGIVGATLPSNVLSVTVGAGGTGASSTNSAGNNGGNTYIACNGTTVYEVTKGFGGGGSAGNLPSSRAGGNYNSGFSNSSGNSTTGGFWWHTGGAGGGASYLYGGGGGGAYEDGGPGSSGSGGYGGAGIQTADFALIGNVPTATKYVSPGGTSGGGTSATLHGGGGRGSSAGGSAGNGYQGIAIIKFY